MLENSKSYQQNVSKKQQNILKSTITDCWTKLDRVLDWTNCNHAMCFLFCVLDELKWCGLSNNLLILVHREEIVYVDLTFPLKRVYHTILVAT